MRSVTFTRAYPPYMAGETAGFSERKAADLVDRRRVAVYVPAKAEQPAETASPRARRTVPRQPAEASPASES